MARTNASGEGPPNGLPGDPGSEYFRSDGPPFKYKRMANGWVAADIIDEDGLVATGNLPAHPHAESAFNLSDVTTNNASASKHGFLPKLANTGTQFLRDDGAWAAAGGGGAHASTHQNGGGDEISVAGLSGLLADAQTPLSHSHGTADINNDAITYAKIQNVSATDRLLGRVTSGAGDIEEVTCTAAGRALLDDAAASDQRTTLGLGTLATQNGTFSGTSSGTNTGDQTITLTGNVTGSGTGSFAATIANDAVTYAKMQNVSATDRLLGRVTSGAGDVEEITCTAAGRAILDDADAAAQRTTLGLGALATLATVGTTQVDNDSVTYAKIQNVTDARLLGRSAGSSGDVQEITVGSGLSLNAGALTATGGGGGTEVFALKTSDQTAIGTSFADVTGTGLSVDVNKAYAFEFVLLCDADATTTGIDVSCNGPASPSSIHYEVVFWTSGTARTERGFTVYNGDTASTASNGTSQRVYRVCGVLRNGANAGTLIARAKREAVGTGPNVRAGSYGRLTPLD